MGELYAGDRIMTWKLSEKQRAKFDVWIEEQKKLAIAQQKLHVLEDSPSYQTYVECWEEGWPYTGATGGDLTFMMIPTSLGCIYKIRHNFTHNEIDLTEYDEW
jgi:hypothetical protein